MLSRPASSTRPIAASLRTVVRNVGYANTGGNAGATAKAIPCEPVTLVDRYLLKRHHWRGARWSDAYPLNAAFLRQGVEQGL